ncbi:MAG: outer membrane lipoprotein-sorting protein [Pseudomonadota bacterium]
MMFRWLKIAACVGVAALGMPSAMAEDPAPVSLNALIHDDADAVAKLIAERRSNEGRAATMHFHLQNKAGRVRERTALMVHSDVEDVERIAIFFNKPAMIEETAFLSHNHEARDDENWLFLPATERVRRIPVSERGDNFMGTDLTYGDVNDNFKFGLDDWTFAHGGAEIEGDKTYVFLSGSAKTEAVRNELGYASFAAKIDLKTAFPVRVEYTDKDGEPLKIVHVHEIDVVGDAHTAMRFTAENLQTGHKTEVHFTNMRYVPNLDQSVFDPSALSYGVPEIG